MWESENKTQKVRKALRNQSKTILIQAWKAAYVIVVWF